MNSRTYGPLYLTNDGLWERHGGPGSAFGKVTLSVCQIAIWLGLDAAMGSSLDQCDLKKESKEYFPRDIASSISFLLGIAAQYPACRVQHVPWCASSWSPRNEAGESILYLVLSQLGRVAPSAKGICYPAREREATWSS